jgi:gamma-glutamylcyclotransferase (GGCT)/AIG2-like uncharacterized protein YtfP
MMKQYLFVYGTLKNKLAPPEIAETVKKLKLVGDGFAYGKLYDLGEFPGAVLGTDDKIFGSVYELPDDENVLPELDEYEGFYSQNPKESLYLRKKTKVYLRNKSLTSWIYEYNQDLSNKRQIKSGNFSSIQAA